MASYSDYPDAVSNNAKRGIELNEKVGNKCATQVGKVRGQQLANKEPITEDTIKRMYSYLSRAEVYYDADNTEACGTISFLLWGGKAGLRWSESKLKEIDKNRKVMNKIERLAEVRNINEVERTAQFVISTESIDRHGTSFKLDGWDLSTYDRNPIVGYNHEVSGSNPDTIIGTSRVFRDGDALIGEVTFEREGNNPLADKVFNKMQDGILKMASVGAIPHEYRYGKEDDEDRNTIYFTRQELVEWSIVSAGSNRDAFKRSADQVDELKKSLEVVEEEVVEQEMGLETKSALRNYNKVKIVTKYL
jgi:phage head maturation protease